MRKIGAKNKRDEGKPKKPLKRHRPPEELLREKILRELKSIAFAPVVETEGKNGAELKLKYSLKALELLCKVSGLLGPERKEGDTGQLDELIEGLREMAPQTDEEEQDDVYG